MTTYIIIDPNNANNFTFLESTSKDIKRANDWVNKHMNPKTDWIVIPFKKDIKTFIKNIIDIKI